jgi:hypothetical protein
MPYEAKTNPTMKQQLLVTLVGFEDLAKKQKKYNKN